MSRKHRVKRVCDNVTTIKVGLDTIKIWTDGGGQGKPGIDITVYSSGGAVSFSHEDRPEVEKKPKNG